MSHGPTVSGISFTERFQREFSRCPIEIQQAAEAALSRLLGNGAANSLRMHRLHGYRPAIYKIDILPNKSWQISFELDGKTAVLIRICTHVEMDRRPR